MLNTGIEDFAVTLGLTALVLMLTALIGAIIRGKNSKWIR